MEYIISSALLIILGFLLGRIGQRTNEDIRQSARRSISLITEPIRSRLSRRGGHVVSPLQRAQRDALLRDIEVEDLPIE